MKRSVSCMMATVIAVSTLGMQALPVFATDETVLTEQNVIQINTAQDFLNTYLSTKTETVVDGAGVASYTLFTTVDESNYLSVLAASTFYQGLSANQILDTATNLLVDKDATKCAQDLALKASIDEAMKAQNIDFVTMVDQANKIWQDVQAKQALLEQQQQEVVQEVEQVEEIPEETVSELPVSTAVLTTTTNLAEEVKPELKTQQTALQTQVKVEQVDTSQQVQLSQPVEEEISPASQVVEAPVEEVVSQPVVSQQTESTTTTTAQSFVDTYLTSSQGAVYAKGNSVNYQNILNSLSAWNKLSKNDQSAVDSILSSKAGTNYATLLQEAQQVKASGGVVTINSYTGVNTGTETNAGLYATLCGMSIAVIGFITRRKKEIH